MSMLFLLTNICYGIDLSKTYLRSMFIDEERLVALNKKLQKINLEKKFILISGPHGAGKTTIGKKLSKISGIPFVSVGELISARPKSERVGSYGLEFFEDWVADNEIDLSKGIILDFHLRKLRPDGFKFPFAQYYIDLIEQYGLDVIIINLVVDLEISKQRINDRGKGENKERMLKDIERYKTVELKNIQKLKDLGVVTDVNGEGPVEQTVEILVTKLKERINPTSTKPIASEQEATLVLNGQGMRVHRERVIPYTAITRRPGAEGQLSVKFFEVYGVQLSSAAQSIVEKAVEANGDKIVLVSRDDIIKGEIGEGAIADNALAIIDEFDQLTLSQLKGRLQEGAFYGDWRETDIDRLNAIRISCAALTRIKVGDKYLLMRYKKDLSDGRHSYIPIGGALVYLSPEDRTLLESLGATEFEDDKDLRFTIPTSKLDVFESWFIQAQGRETDPMRELQEELVYELNIFTREQFSNLIKILTSGQEGVTIETLQNWKLTPTQL